MMLVIGVVDGYGEIVVVVVFEGGQLFFDEVVDVVVYFGYFWIGYQEFDYWCIVFGQWVQLGVIVWIGQYVYVEYQVGIQWQVVFEVEGFDEQGQW